jgi:hypothetical protein
LNGDRFNHTIFSSSSRYLESFCKTMLALPSQKGLITPTGNEKAELHLQTSMSGGPGEILVESLVHANRNEYHCTLSLLMQCGVMLESGVRSLARQHESVTQNSQIVRHQAVSGTNKKSASFLPKGRPLARPPPLFKETTRGNRLAQIKSPRRFKNKLQFKQRRGSSGATTKSSNHK